MRPYLACALILGACSSSSEPPVDHVALANKALDDGLPKRALLEVSKATEGPALIARLQVLIQQDEWGTFEKLEKAVPAGPDKVALACLLAAQRKDVDGEKRCRAAGATPSSDATLADAAERALGVVLETEHRREEAELTLRNLALKHPTNANRKAVVALLERQGFVREAVAFLESWLATTPGDKSLELKLVQTLERKVRGDLLDKRGDDAEAAARRILALAPERAQIRYFLADALDLKGEKTAAEVERATAKAAGATPPVPVDTMPGMDGAEPDHHP